MISPATDSFEYLLHDNEKNPLAKGARTTQRNIVEVTLD